MKLWMVSFSYMPMVISATVSPKELCWSWPIYLYTAIGVLIAIGLLYLMTKEPVQSAVVTCRQHADEKFGCRSEPSGELMQMILQVNN